MYEIVDIELSEQGEKLPPKNDKILLVDADTMIYKSCLNCQVEVIPDEDEDVETIPTYNEKLGIYTIIADFKELYTYAEKQIQRLLDLTGCQKYELHFTGNKKNSFRYKFYKNYKANRKKLIPPAGLYELKQYFELNHKENSFIHNEWEADDIVVYKKRTEPDNYILCAIDKDVLNAVAGKHFNYYESIKYDKRPHFIETTEKQAKFWPYYQTIIGDKSDNIIGPSGIGPKRALKFINKDMTEKEMWEGVVNAYESKGMSEFDAIINMNLVNMNLLDKDESGKFIVRKWQPNFDKEGNYVWE